MATGRVRFKRRAESPNPADSSMLRAVRSASPEQFAGTDRFEVRRRLGRGGMGVVYEAFDRERGHAVALKTFTPAKWEQAQAGYAFDL